MTAIVGPTAVGKTELSVEVAQRLGAEIVSVDSMQIYRGMNIGTAKPGQDILDAVPHHLIDVCDPDHNVTVAEFQQLARAAIADISDRGGVPLLVGGAGLYMRAVLDDLQFPARSPEVRRSLEDEARELGAEALHERLTALDPVSGCQDRACQREKDRTGARGDPDHGPALLGQHHLGALRKHLRRGDRRPRTRSRHPL